VKGQGFFNRLGRSLITSKTFEHPNNKRARIGFKELEGRMRFGLLQNPLESYRSSNILKTQIIQNMKSNRPPVKSFYKITLPDGLPMRTVVPYNPTSSHHFIKAFSKPYHSISSVNPQSFSSLDSYI